MAHVSPLSSDGVQEEQRKSSSLEEIKDSKIDEEEELERLAVEALLQEARRGKSRAEQVGAMGWTKCDLHKTNKRFLRNIVTSTMSSNRKRVRPEPSRSPVSPHQQSRKARRPSVNSGREHSHYHHHHHKGSREERREESRKPSE